MAAVPVSIDTTFGVPPQILPGRPPAGIPTAGHLLTLKKGVLMATQQRGSGARESGGTWAQRWNRRTGGNGAEGGWPPGSARPSSGERLALKLGWVSLGLGVAQLLAPDRLLNLIGVRASDDARTLQRVVGAREVMAGVGILTGQPTPWVWARVAGDLMDLVLLGMAFNARNADRDRVAMA